MGVTVREKKNGSGIWWVFINHQGRRKSVKVGAEKAANEVKASVEAELKKGQLGLLQGKKDKLLFKDCASTWSELQTPPKNHKDRRVD